MSDSKPLRGLVAATYTPMLPDGTVAYQQVGPMVDFLRRQQQVDGLYVCGSTGEGISLTVDERRDLASEFRRAAGELPVVVQVGHNSLREARRLAEHAASIEATAFSANAPSYFKVLDVETLVDCMQQIAEAAPALPFYYYHIPHLTGAQIDMLQFLRRAAERIPNLVGLKYTAPTLHEYRACVTHDNGKYDILWGSDEMLLPALSMGATGAVGSTYNVAGKVYQQLMASFDAGDLATAQRCQDQCNAMIRTIYQYPFHSAMKAVLRMLGLECGQCRLPQQPLAAENEQRLRDELREIGFFSWNA